MRWRHRARVLEAMALLIVSMLTLRIVPVGRLLRWCRLPICSAPPADAPLAECEIGDAVLAAVQRLGQRPNCLPQAIAAGIMLRRRGSTPRIAFGARRRDGTLTAHAWLIADTGIVCGGEAARAMTPFRCSKRGTSS